MLEDSRVLSWGVHDGSLVFDVDFSLWPGHPLYHPPKPDEWTCYRKGKLVFEEVSSLEGLRPIHDVRPAIGADDELDYGNIDHLEETAPGRFAIHGEFGDVRVQCRRLRFDWHEAGVGDDNHDMPVKEPPSTRFLGTQPDWAILAFGLLVLLALLTLVCKKLFG